ncbi:MAG: LysR family transcriptional regulator [Bernardetiaceae bacterium]
MTLQQLEYVVALAEYGKFSEAAYHCHVTQPTLSMQLKKLEDELELVLFDRQRQPIRPTPAGKAIIRQAKEILRQVRQLEDWVQSHKNKLEGDLRLGIIPTLAPYLVPYFLGEFVRTFPRVHLHIREARTEEITLALHRQELDLGLLVTPIADEHLRTQILFYEKFMAYLHPEESKQHGNRIALQELLQQQLWVLSEGNCFRDQAINLCAVSQLDFRHFRFTYESGSLESLMRLVDREGGLTLLPELAVLQLPDERLDQVKFIGDTSPVREVSLLYHERFAKFALLEALSEQIIGTLPEQVRQNSSQYTVPI